MDDRSTVLTAIERRLEELEQADARLAQPLAFYRKLLPALRKAPPLASLPPLDLAAAGQRLAAGQSLLGGQKISISPEPAQALFRQVCALIAEFQPAAQEALRALDSGRLPLIDLLEAMAGGHLEAIEPAAETGEVSAVLLRMLLEYTLRPSLRSWAGQVEGLLSLDDWQQTRCPVCDSPPLLSEIRGSARARWLRCGICGAAWPYPRLRCALCGNTDAGTQSMVCEDGEEKIIYAHTCKRCHGYIKCLYTPTPLLVDLLPVEDLATLYLDQGCQERGYARFAQEERF